MRQLITGALAAVGVSCHHNVHPPGHEARTKAAISWLNELNSGQPPEVYQT